MSIDDPYKISATNAPTGLTPKTEMPITIEIPLPTDEKDKTEENDKEEKPDQKPILDRVSNLGHKNSPWRSSQLMVLVFAGASFLVILFALLLARSGNDSMAVYCRDLPSWNQTVDCI